MKKIKVTIEGEFVESYIYSGHLILVDKNYQLNVYKWDSLVGLALKGTGFPHVLLAQELLKDSRLKISPSINDACYSISKSDLESCHVYSMDVGVYPSDINVFANVLYISSENGVSRFDFNYEDGKLHNKFVIFDEMSFSISPNSSNRLAIAAGKSGVLTFIPRSKHLSKLYLSELMNETCTDLDWQSTVLLANTYQGVKRANYKQMPLRDEYGDIQDYFEALKFFREFKPKIYGFDNELLAWVGGDKLFSLSSDNKLKISSINNSELDINTMDVGAISDVLKAKTASFGTVVETNEQLLLINDEGVNELFAEPINWRVFPRATNHSNQIHIIQEQFMEITIVESPDNNRYGFKPETVDFRG
ncbi:hypothetical protein VCSRO70_3585 [Vibrio cholerae]|nr:hypothetical protein VCSRO70_3585 [Vibrio cholerae]